MGRTRRESRDRYLTLGMHAVTYIILIPLGKDVRHILYLYGLVDSYIVYLNPQEKHILRCH